MIRYQGERTIPLQVDAKTWKKSSGTQREQFVLDPGAYFFEFQLKDEIAGKMGIYKKSIVVPEYRCDSLKLSDVLLAGTISETAAQSAFKKGALAYEPHMFKAFERGEQVGIYYEIYNLFQDEQGMTDYYVTWSLGPVDFEQVSVQEQKKGLFAKLFGKKSEIVQTAYRYSGRRRDERMHMNFDIGNRKPGVYDLIIEVEDYLAADRENKKVRIVIE